MWQSVIKSMHEVEKIQSETLELPRLQKWGVRRATFQHAARLHLQKSLPKQVALAT